MTLDKLANKLEDIEETQETARSELAILNGSCQRLEELERDREALMERYAGAVTEALESLTPRSATMYRRCSG
jgi:chromosome segregation ATPase